MLATIADDAIANYHAAVDRLLEGLEDEPEAAVDALFRLHSAIAARGLIDPTEAEDALARVVDDGA